jgi:hypothetical protein
VDDALEKGPIMDSENTGTTSSGDVPEADLVEQQLPILPDESEEPAEKSTTAQIPSEAPEADYLEQHVSAVPGREGRPPEPAFEAAAGASEADLAEQALSVPIDEEEYPFGAAGDDVE